MKVFRWNIPSPAGYYYHHHYDSGSSSNVGPTSIVPNPAYIKWCQQDHMVVNYITSTLTKPVLTMTVGHDSAQEVWECLHQHYSQKAVAYSANLHFQLLNLHKGIQTVANYVRHTKGLVLKWYQAVIFLS